MGFFFLDFRSRLEVQPCLAATTATLATIAVATAVKLYVFTTAWPIQARCRLLHHSLWHAKGRNLHFVLWICIACQPTHKLALYTLVVMAYRPTHSSCELSCNLWLMVKNKGNRWYTKHIFYCELWFFIANHNIPRPIPLHPTVLSFL
jgi:hypothetical protein